MLQSRTRTYQALMSNLPSADRAPRVSTERLGDMDAATFRKAGHDLVDWISRYLEDVERYPVLSRAKPGDVRKALPGEAPRVGESWDAITADPFSLERTGILALIEFPACAHVFDVRKRPPV